jgi:transposase
MTHFRNAPHPDWLDLDREIPAGHLARQVRLLVEHLDLSDLLETYTGVGSPIIPPALLLAFVLYEMHNKRLSPADWFKDSRESLPARWLLKGFRPSRAVFYRFRDHLPAALLLHLNRQVLLLAVAEGHTTAECGSLDGTFTAAYGSRHRLLTSKGLADRLEVLDKALAVPCQPPLPPQPKCPPLVAASRPADATPGPAGWPYWLAKSQAGRRRQQLRYRRAEQILHSRLVDHDKRQTQRPKNQRKKADEVVICANEPEAVMGKDKCKVFRPLYNTQIVQDVDSPFVLGYGLYAQANDTGLLPPMLERTKQLTGKQLKEVLADGSYATLGAVRYCQQEQVELYAPTRANPEEKGAQGKEKKAGKGAAKWKEKHYGKEKFKWEEKEQTYRCPQGHLLQLGVRGKGERRQEEDVVVQQYRCAKENCQKCQQAGQCTSRPDKGRTIKRMEGQELLDELAARMRSEKGKGKYKRRSQTVEPRHGDMKEHRGLRQMSGYGKEKGESQVGMLVLVNNGLYLLRARAKRQRTAEPARATAKPSVPLPRPTPQPAAALPILTVGPVLPSPGPTLIPSSRFSSVADNDDWLRFD